MKILLAVSVSVERFHVIPDIGLGYLAAMARDAGHEVEFLDCIRHHLSMDDWELEVATRKPDLVGIKSYSADLAPVSEMLDRVKRVSPDITTVIGGPHPSTEGAKGFYKQFPSLDFAFAGEAEPGWLSFLEMMETGNHDFESVPGLAWIEEDGTVKGNEKVLHDDLDSLPLPDWDMMKPHEYKWGYSFMTNRYPAAPMILTRGCPYLCTFCGSYLITGRKVRKRSIDNVIEEIKILKSKYGVRSIDIVDENFVFYRDYVMEFCNRLIEEKIEIGWNCPYGVRLDRLDAELVSTMEKAGCYALSFGIESATNRILKEIKKVLTVEQTIEKVNMVRKAAPSMMLQGFFMIGFPDETEEEIEATIELARDLPLDIAIFSPLRPTPGTKIYEDLVNSGVIYASLDYDPEGMGQHYFVRSYSPVPDEKMKLLYRKAYKTFYFRPKIIANLLWHTRSKAQARTIFNGIKRLLQRPITKLDIRKPKKEDTPDMAAAGGQKS
jgi:radical SAM superfamily enzyme YgiQ (UPF0313 family)